MCASTWNWNSQCCCWAWETPPSDFLDKGFIHCSPVPGHPEPLPGPSLSPPLSQRVLVLDTFCSHSLSLRAPDSPHSRSQCDPSLAQCSGCTFCCHSSMLQSLGPCWQHPPLEQSDTASPLCTAKWESAVFGSGTPESSVSKSSLCR